MVREVDCDLSSQTCQKIRVEQVTNCGLMAVLRCLQHLSERGLGVESHRPMSTRQVGPMEVLLITRVEADVRDVDMLRHESTLVASTMPQRVMTIDQNS